MKSFEDSILRVLKGDTVVGAAFLVSDCFVATCAHVVDSADAKVGGEISLQLATGKKVQATVDPNFWRDPNAEDIVILRLDNALENLQPVILGSSSGTKGHKFSTFGFPAKGQELSGGGQIVGQAVIDGIELLQLRSPEVTPGFSGAPTFDETTKRVVGMVTAITPPDEYQRLGTTAFAIPSETIRETCIELQISDICPYRSLDVFNEVDAQFFFGRERVVQKMVDSLKREPRFLALLGPSGSGKSSAVRAGLVPILKQGKVPGSDKWSVIVVRPASQPFEQLDNVGLLKSQDGIENAVRAWFEKHSERTRLVLIIDQFEELLVSTPQDICQNFIKELASLLDASVSITIVLTLRDDFYSRFLQDAAPLADWLEGGLVNIPATIEENELHTIIHMPAHLIGIHFEAGLINRIISDAITADIRKERIPSTILPLLEFALTQLWEEREDGQLTHSAYDKFGGVTGGLAQWADRAYYDFSLDERDVARRIMLDLVHLEGESYSVAYTRRIRKVFDLLYSNTAISLSVINSLVKVRLLSTWRNNKTFEEMIELTHEALLYEWGQMQKWLDDDRAFLIWHESLQAALRTWEQKDHDEGALLRGILLSEAEDWLRKQENTLGENELSFIQLSLALHKRESLEREAQQQRDQENLRKINELQNLYNNSNEAQLLIHKLEIFTQTLSMGGDIDAWLNGAVEVITSITGAQASSLYLFDKSLNKLVIRAACGYHRPLLNTNIAYSLGEGVTGAIAKDGAIIRANNLEELHWNPAWRGKYNPYQNNREPNSFLGVPLKVENRLSETQEIIGVLKVEDIVPTEGHPESTFTDQDVLLVNMMANIISTVAYNFQFANARINKIATDLSHITNSLAGGGDIHKLADRVLSAIASILRAGASSLYLLDVSSSKLQIEAATGYQYSLVSKGAEYRLGEGVTGYIAKYGNALKADSLEQLHSMANWLGKYNSDQNNREPNAFLGLPLKLRDPSTDDEMIIGVLKVEDLYPSPEHPEMYFTDMDVLLVQMVANIISSALYNLKLAKST
jgi:hypothetical protein